MSETKSSQESKTWTETNGKVKLIPRKMAVCSYCHQLFAPVRCLTCVGPCSRCAVCRRKAHSIYG